MKKKNREEGIDRAARLKALVEALGNVSEACRQLNLDRSFYYRMRRRAGKEDDPARSRISKPPELEHRLLELCFERPEWGCDRLAYYLTLTGNPVSSPTVQKILIRHGLGRKAARLAALAERQAKSPP